jgi:hypothetical protein
MGLLLHIQGCECAGFRTYGTSRGRDEVWAVPTLGGAPRSVVSASFVAPSPDGTFVYYAKSDSAGLFRAGSKATDIGARHD